MDENGDGVLDRQEIEHCVRNLGFPFEEVSLLALSIFAYISHPRCNRA
jgi:Ca2+-binding EF-hand superfamily protein